MTTETAEFEPVATAYVAPEAPENGKRPRGRPRKSVPTGTGEIEPQRSARPRQPRRAKLETQVGAALVRANFIVTVAATYLPGLDPSDALDGPEIMALSSAITTEANRHPRFRRMVESAVTVTSAGDLVFVVSIIAARRLARHGILPAMVDDFGGAALADPAALASMLGNMTAPEPEPPTMPDAEPVTT